MKPIFKYILSVIIYGTIGPILRFINLPSEVVVLCRGLLGSLFILLFTKVKSKPLDTKAIKRNIKPLIFGGIFLGLNWVFLFGAYIVTSVAIASIFNYMAPIILVILAPLLYKEKLTSKKTLCVIFAFIGIVLVSDVLSAGQSINIKGILLAEGACLGFVGLVICNKKLKDIGTYERVIIELSVSALVVLPYAIIHNLNNPIILDLKSVLLTLMLGIIHTGVAYCLYFGSINDIGVNQLAIFGYLEPIVSIILSWIFLNEAMDTIGIIGAILVLGSALISETNF